MSGESTDGTEQRTVEFPRLTDEEHSNIIEALAFYKQRRFAVRPDEIDNLQRYIRKNVQHLDTDTDQGDNDE